jgi:hypothetical protein
MQEELITLETAKLAKEKGFDYFNGIYKTQRSTQSLLQKWLREIHKIDINLRVNQFGYGYSFSIIDLKFLKSIRNLQ